MDECLDRAMLDKNYLGFSEFVIQRMDKVQ